MKIFVLLIVLCGISKTEGAPQLFGQTEGYNGYANRFYHLSCNIPEGDFTYEWYLNDNKVSSQKYVQFGNRLFIIKTPASPDYQGVYYCKGTNKEGTRTGAKMIVKFKIQAAFHEAHDQTTSVKVTVGKDFKLQCPSHTSPPDVHYNWGGTRPLTGVWHISQSAHYMIMEDGSLLFANVKDQDIENFNVVYDGVSCGMETRETGKMTFSKKFLLRQNTTKNTTPFGPTIKTTLKDKEVTQGTIHVVLRCGAIGLPTPSYSWTFTGLDGVEKPVKHGENGYQLSRYGHIFIIQTVEVEQDGLYKCKANSTYGGTEHVDEVNARITVRGKPRWLPNGQLTEATPVLGQKYKWHCKATAIPKPTYTWHFNGTQLSHSEAHSTFDGELTFHQVGKSNEGRYQCIAENEFGRISCSASLRLIPVSEICEKSKVNLIFLIDGSANVSATVLDGFKLFTKSLIQKFDVGANDTHVSVLQFTQNFGVSLQRNDEFGNNKYITFGVVFGEYSLDGYAMKMANDIMTKEGRTDARNVMILLMDNGLRDIELVKKQSRELRQKGTKLVMIDTKYNDQDGTTSQLADIVLKYTAENVQENVEKVAQSVCR